MRVIIGILFAYVLFLFPFLFWYYVVTPDLLEQGDFVRFYTSLDDVQKRLIWDTAPGYRGHDKEAGVNIEDIVKDSVRQYRARLREQW